MSQDPQVPSMKWMVESHTTLYSAGPVQEIAVQSVRLPDGRLVPDYYRIRLADFVLVFATTGDGDVLMVRQYKHGPGRECLCFPGGAIAEGESPEAAAARELMEETGYVSDRWISLGAFVTNANQRCNAAHLFVAEGCRRVTAPTAPDLENGELILVPAAELLSRITLDAVGLASHVALLAIATHPGLRHPSVVATPRGGPS